MTDRAIGPARAAGRDTPVPRAAIVCTAAIALAVAAGVALFSIVAVFDLHVALPIWDAWATVADAQLVRQGTYGWAELTRQHNEHRLLFPRLLFWADRSWFAMSDLDLLAECFALQAITAVVLIRLGLRRGAGWPAAVVLAGFVVAVLFSLDQEQNLTAGFQVQFVGVFTAAAIGAAAHAAGLDRFGAKALPGPRRSGGWSRLAGAGLACFVATYTMANGVLLGFVFVVLAALLRAPRRAIAATLVMALALAGLFVHGYALGPDSGSVASVAAHPLATAAFVLAYLGGAAGTDTRIALPFGALGLAGLGLAAWRLAAGRGTAATAALVAVGGFVAASACVTAYGRAQYGIEDAFETRYVTPAAVFWCALVAFWFEGCSAATRASRAMLAALAAVMVWLAAAAVVGEVTEWPFMVDQTAAIRRFRDSLWSGLYDLDASSYENNADADLRPLLPFLAAERLSLYAAPEPRERGMPAAALGPSAPDGACTGSVAARSDPALGRDGVRVTGTAWDSAGDRPVRRILTVGPDGTLSGFGSPDRPVGRPRGWSGYATAASGRDIEAYAVLADGRLCRLGAAEVAAP